MARDWTDLLPELLQLMSKKLTSMSDFIRLRAACTRWRNILYPPSGHLPPLLPWLILPRNPNSPEDANLGSLLSMYDLSESRTHILDLPAIQGKHICGSSHGWLVLEKEREVWLLNPITRDEISLPSLSVQPNTLQGNNKGALLQSASTFCIMKAILSSNPRMDSSCLVMALLEGSWKTAFCRIGDECWTTVLVEGNAALQSPIVDIGYHNSLFYAICHNGHAWICNFFNTHLNRVSSLVNNHHEICMCTVEGGGDEQRFMVYYWNYVANAYWFLMLSVEQESWLPVDQEHSDSKMFFVGGLFHCIAIPAVNLQLDGWVGGTTCYLETENGEMVGSVKRYRCRIRRQEYIIDDASVVSTLATNLDLFLDPNSTVRHVKTPHFVWLTPTLSYLNNLS